MPAQTPDLRDLLISNGFSRAEIERLADRFSELRPEEQVLLAQLAQKAEEEARAKACARGFLPFVEDMWPEFVPGEHHEVLADCFERMERGECDRAIINMGPRHTKTKFTSVFLPAWTFGKRPNQYFMQVGATADLATENGREVRDLISSARYQRVFSGTALHKAVKGAGAWHTSKGGKYFAAGVGGRIVGRGAHWLVIDDPHSEQDGQLNTSYDSVYDWFPGAVQRLQPGGKVLIVMTRWHKRDLTGRLLEAMRQGGNKDQWEVIELPAILDEHGPNERALWPERGLTEGFDLDWALTDLKRMRSNMLKRNWNAQYQQDPTSEEAAIVKREWWKTWPWPIPDSRSSIGEFRHPIDFIIQSWDTALSDSKEADYSACTTWGVFSANLKACEFCGGAGQVEVDNEVKNCLRCKSAGYYEPNQGKPTNHIVLLDAFQERLQFPDLKARAFKEYQRWKPDNCLIEAKASGLSLVQELRRAGIPVHEIPISRGNTKILRVDAISDLFKSGFIWAPITRAADEVIEQFAAFQGKPGDTDDLVDSSAQALLRFRQGGFIRLYSDQEEREDQQAKRARVRQSANYYWTAGSR